jgi:hypothetical protein
MSLVDRFNPVYVAALLFPTVCVLASQFLGSGASSAKAASEKVSELEPMQWERISFSAYQSEAISDESIGSPFYFEPVEPMGQPVDSSPQDPRPTQQVRVELPEVHVTSILPNPKNPLAIIDGKPRRIGDTLDTGWKVISINASDFTVTLRHDSGKEIRARMKKN